MMLHTDTDWKAFASKIQELESRIDATYFPDNLLKYLVTGEDHRYWKHLGIDPIGLIRAAYQSLFFHCRQGASTIAMQLVRTITGEKEITVKRKLKEFYFATRLTLSTDRKKILKLYLSIAYFGWDMHGIHQAYKRLNLSEKSLNDYDAASLIARLKYPQPRHKDEEKLEKITIRTKYIMRRQKYIKGLQKYGTI